jgi:hypothetical protein
MDLRNTFDMFYSLNSIKSACLLKFPGPHCKPLPKHVICEQLFEEVEVVMRTYKLTTIEDWRAAFQVLIPAVK